MNKDQNSILCNWCGQSTSIIWVHGRGQYKKCGTNIDECCRGEHNTNFDPKEN